MARKYQLKRRAEKQQETRQRIVEAVVSLHEELGPSQTTISAIAERAGVQRLTVYRHFPDEPSLFEACRDHWMTACPLPDADAWLEITDPRQRLRRGLHDMYAYYGRAEHMIANVARDASLIPTLAEAQQPFFEKVERMHAVLKQGVSIREERQAIFDAALYHALSFEAWRSLVREQGMPVDAAVEIMACMLGCAADPAACR